jgi:hypothetical protein
MFKRVVKAKFAPAVGAVADVMEEARKISVQPPGHELRESYQPLLRAVKCDHGDCTTGMLLENFAFKAHFLVQGIDIALRDAAPVEVQTDLVPMAEHFADKIAGVLGPDVVHLRINQQEIGSGHPELSFGGGHGHRPLQAHVDVVSENKMAPIGLGCSEVDFLVPPRPELLDQARVVSETRTCFPPCIVVHDLLPKAADLRETRLDLTVRSDTRQLANKYPAIYPQIDLSKRRRGVRYRAHPNPCAALI